tara:strand:+ start:35174 stop:39250 length:4077 start_codon:yes stop_codon:yes gene_type:complete
MNNLKTHTNFKLKVPHKFYYFFEYKVNSMHRLLLFLLLTSSFLKGYPQEPPSNYLFNYLTSKNGISSSYVSKVVSDSLNIKWIATENGITKYDGNSFQYIKPGHKYPRLENEIIETLFIDSKNNLWIGTRIGGLSMLDIARDSLSNYNSLLTNKTLRIRAIEEDEEGNIWVSTQNNGVYVINPFKNELLRHLKVSGSWFLKRDSKGDIWFSDKPNLKRYTPKTNRIRTYNMGAFITAFVEDVKNNCVWTGFVDDNNKHHLTKLDLSTEKLSSISTGIPSKFTSTLFLDKDNKLWVGTWGNGLYQGFSNNTAFRKINLVYPPNISKTNSYEVILDIHHDKNNDLWISTAYGGVVIASKSKGFYNLDQFYQYDELLGNMDFLSVYKSKTKIFLGTSKKGVFYGENLASLKHLKASKDLEIRTISEHNNQICLGTNEGLLFLKKNQQVEKKLAILKATKLYSENENTLWVGTQQDGLFKINTNKNMANTNIVSHYKVDDTNSKLESNRITDIQKDSNGKLWVTTFNGLHLYNRKTNSFTHYSKFSSDHIPRIINAIFIDSKNIWLGTPSGLYKLIYRNNQLTIDQVYFTDKSGTKSEFISAITTDNQNHLWLTTSNSLIKFNKFDESFVYFSESDGIYSSTFNPKSIYSDLNNAIIYCGGTNNLTYFNTEDIFINNDNEGIIFTNLKVGNTQVNKGTIINNKVLLEKDFCYTKSITLSHLEKSFTISFSNTDYFNEPTRNYRYRLVGYSNEWNIIDKQKSVNFVGLPADNYTLEVSSSRDFINWTTSKPLKITILYNPWKSPLAYTIYGSLFFLILFLFTRIRMNQLHLKQTLQQEKELSNAKFTFFTNISHEIRTPLTLIVSPLKDILQNHKNLEPELTEKLVTIEKNSNRLFNLITQLLDFRKAEHGLLKLNMKNGNFARFSYEVFLYFKEQARIKAIDYSYNCNQNEILFPFDRNKMEIVLCNLISNALKYTKANDRISLIIKSTNNYCYISIKDNGIGMDKGYKKKIFDRFYQIQSTNTTNVVGSGIGLSFSKQIIELHHGRINVESNINEGTEFTIELPMNYDFYNEDINIEANKLNTDDIESYKQIEDSSIKDLKVKPKENTLLIVDDNDDIRNYLKKLLEKDYNILESKNGIEGVETATKEIPDLILCDIMMPKKDGLSVCKDLKSQTTTSHIPIILLTARSSNLYELQGLGIGADDFITKPFDPQIIKARIASALQNRSKIRAYFLNKIRFEPATTEVIYDDPENAFINKAILLVENNLSNEHFDIKTMMDTFHMSQSSLYRKVKSLTGLSVIAFIRSVRLKKAAEYILTENDKLSTVSQKVGFNDYKYFRDSFKKQFDCLPSEYKSIKKNKN